MFVYHKTIRHKTMAHSFMFAYIYEARSLKWKVRD